MGTRAPLPGESSAHHQPQYGGGDYNNSSDDHGGGYNNYPQHGGVPSTPQIRTPKELELSVARGLGNGAPTILYSHANAEDLGNIYPWCKFLSKMLGVNIFAYDYTGYGLATDQGEMRLLFDLCILAFGWSWRVHFVEHFGGQEFVQCMR